MRRPHAAGWLGAVVLLASIPSENGGLSLRGGALRQWVQSVDIIILVLANVSVFGSLIWLATRASWQPRLVRSSTCRTSPKHWPKKYCR